MHVLDVDVRAGDRCAKPVDVLAEIVESDGIDGCQPDRVAGRILSPLHRFFELVVAVDDLLATLEEELALRRQLPRAARPVDQLRAEPPLELAHGLTGGGLAHRVGQRAPREALVPDHVAEDVERLQMHEPATVPTPAANGKRALY